MWRLNRCVELSSQCFPIRTTVGKAVENGQHTIDVCTGGIDELLNSWIVPTAVAKVVRELEKAWKGIRAVAACNTKHEPRG